jgi:multiple sugar transport system substrate-binding protein
MIDAYKSGLVPAGNINMIDMGALTAELAHNRVAAAICDYSGDVGSIYDVASISSVVNQIAYAPNPGVKGPVPGLANMDGIGIPVTARNKVGAVEFLKWFNSTQNQAVWSGLDGAKGIIAGIPLPTRISSLQLLAAKKVLSQSQEHALVAGLEDSLPIFPGKAPAGYIPFYTTVYDTIHSAAAGQVTLQQAVRTIANAARQITG